MDPHTMTRDVIHSDLQSRVLYMKSFLDFSDDDCEIMNEIKPIAKPLVPEIVASAYNKMLSYECCRIAFFPRKDGAQGTHGTAQDLVDTQGSMELNSAAIKFRRNILERWAMRIFTADYRQMEIFEFFDQVGTQHVGGARVFSGALHKPVFVDYIHLAMTLGFITNQMTSAILTLPASTWPHDKKNRAVLAFHKISAIQNDLLSRHHIGDHFMPPTFPENNPDTGPVGVVSPRNRKDYYNKVFAIRSPPTSYSGHMPDPPNDAPFQSLINVAPTTRPDRAYARSDVDMSPPTCMQFTTTCTSSEYNPRPSNISSFGDDASYFPGSFDAPNSLPTTKRRMSKRNVLKFAPKNRP